VEVTEDATAVKTTTIGADPSKFEPFHAVPGKTWFGSRPEGEWALGKELRCLLSRPGRGDQRRSWLTHLLQLCVLGCSAQWGAALRLGLTFASSSWRPGSAQRRSWESLHAIPTLSCCCQPRLQPEEALAIGPSGTANRQLA
jgi:hypothetical protein